MVRLGGGGGGGGGRREREVKIARGCIFHKLSI